MQIEITAETHRQIEMIAKTMKVSESEVIESCIGHRFKMLLALKKYRESHPHRGWGRTSEYDIWKGIMRRCFDPKCAAYPDYGGRGITVAPELLTLQGFLQAVGRRPAGMSLDRIDNDGNYEPSNLRWASPTVQNSNKRCNDLLTFQGKTQTLTAWARELKISQTSLWMRLYRHKWSVEQALSTPAFTRQEAAQRATAKHRGGHSLTPDDVRTIRDSIETQDSLAKQFRVAQSTIWRIKNRKRWANIK